MADFENYPPQPPKPSEKKYTKRIIAAAGVAAFAAVGIGILSSAHDSTNEPASIASASASAVALPSETASPQTPETSFTPSQEPQTPSQTTPATSPSATQKTPSSKTGIWFTYTAKDTRSGTLTQQIVTAGGTDRAAKVHLRCEGDTPYADLDTYNHGKLVNSYSEHGYPEAFPNPCNDDGAVKASVIKHPTLYGSLLLAVAELNGAVDMLNPNK